MSKCRATRILLVLKYTATSSGFWKRGSEFSFLGGLYSDDWHLLYLKGNFTFWRMLCCGHKLSQLTWPLFNDEK